MRSKSIASLIALLVLVALAVAPVSAKPGKGKKPQPQPSATEIAIAHLGVDPATVKVTDQYTSAHNGVTHVYLRQLSDGVEIAGADATVNIQNGAVIFSGSRFVEPEAPSGEQLVTGPDAIAIARSAVDAAPDADIRKPVVQYRVLRNGRVRLVFDIQIVSSTHWWAVSVDAATGKVVQRMDFVDSENIGEVAARTARSEDAPLAAALLDPVLTPQQVDDGSTYNVYPMPLESPNDGSRQIVANPADALASPFGWHDTNGLVGPEYTITRGNNVNAYIDSIDGGGPDPGSQPDGGPGLDFNHAIPTFDATPLIYRDAAVDNLFFWNNVMHDVTYRYGFNEAAGNFQQSNYSGKGRGGDAVNAEAQDGSGALNANFSTPADGQPGRMQMYLWVDAFDTLGLGPEDVVRPYSHQARDGDLDSGVIAHEYGHGVSNRLVGGPNNVSCLRTHDEREGEGWSDWWSYVLTMRPGDDGATPRGIGTYVVYHEGGRSDTGIRITPYSTDMEIDPATYNTIKTAAEPHGVGYVWASMLWDLYWNLVDKYGFNPNPYEAWNTGGNNLAIQLVVDGMKFAPCEPGFEDARDAIIAADAALTGNPSEGVAGANECLIWSTFARRGLGVNADQGDFESKTDGVEGYAVPARCQAG
jgi:Fungalysin metallopeptidase (M36)/Fungalysin/Thermolysin Propeptide Motif